MNPFTKTEVDPSYSKTEMALNQALASAMMMAGPLPSDRVLFPPRFGYVRSEPTLLDVLGTDRNMMTDRRLDYSGVQTRYSAGTRPALGQV